MASRTVVRRARHSNSFDGDEPWLETEESDHEHLDPRNRLLRCWRLSRLQYRIACLVISAGSGFQISPLLFRPVGCGGFHNALDSQRLLKKLWTSVNRAALGRRRVLYRRHGRQDSTASPATRGEKNGLPPLSGEHVRLGKTFLLSEGAAN
jgi:hypothetical protein